MPSQESKPNEEAKIERVKVGDKVGGGRVQQDGSLLYPDGSQTDAGYFTPAPRRDTPVTEKPSTEE